MNDNEYLSTICELSFPMSKVDVTRPSNFHIVLRNSVSGKLTLLTGHETMSCSSEDYGETKVIGLWHISSIVSSVT